MSLIARYPLLSNSNDAVGSNNGTDTNITYSNSAIFNGTTSQIDCGNPAIFNFGTNPFTIFVRFKSSTVARRTIVNKYEYTGGATESGFYIDVLANGKVRAIIETSPTASRFIDSAVTVNDGGWHTVAFVRTAASTTNLYIDGVLSNGSVGGINVANVLSVSNTKTFKIGAQSDEGISPDFSQNWDGSIKDVRIWDNALSAAQVKALQNTSNFLPFFFQK